MAPRAPVVYFLGSLHAFELGPFMRLTREGAVERKPIARGGEWLGSSAAGRHRQQRGLQPHRGARGLRASGDDIPYC